MCCWRLLLITGEAWQPLQSLNNHGGSVTLWLWSQGGSVTLWLWSMAALFQWTRDLAGRCPGTQKTSLPPHQHDGGGPGGPVMLSQDRYGM
ncbi:unnamed protein product [Gadus morhua 'NCC']